MKKLQIREQLLKEHQISFTFQRVYENREHGVLEGTIRVDLVSGVNSIVRLEVREHHGKRYSTEQKQKIRTVLDGIRLAVEAILEESWERVESFPSEDD